MREFNFIKRKNFFVLIFFVFIGFFLVSCQSTQKKAVATIDGQSISGEYFSTTVSDRFHEKTREDQRKELTDFYHTVLRAHDAKEKDLDRIPELKYRIHVEQRSIKVQQLYEAYVVDHVITEEMVKEAYQNMDERRTVRHILITDSTATRPQSDRSPAAAEDLALEIKQKIASGELSFPAAAKEYSEGPSADKGGDLGAINWGQMVPPFQRAAWRLTPNTISDPVRTQYGVHLIEVTDVDTVNLGSFEEARPRIVRNMQRSKRNEIRERTQEALKQIKDETGFSIDQQAIDSVATQLFKQYQVANKTGKSTDLVDLTTEINYLPVGTLVGDSLEKKDFKRLLNYIQHNNYNGLPNKSYLVRRITGELQQEYIFRFAEDYGISDYRDTAYKVRWKEDQALNDHYVKKVVLKDFPPSEDSLRAYFERVKFEKYSTPSDVHVQEIYFTDEQTAENVRQQLAAGADFDEMAAKHTQRESAQERQGDLGWFETDRYGPIGHKAETMEKGAIEGPFQVGTGWSIIKLMDRKEGETKSFADIRKQVKRDYTDYYRPLRLEQNILTLEEKYNSELYYSYLESL